MSFSLIYIRYLQAIRALKDGGLGSFLLPILIAGLSFASFKAFQNIRYGAMLILLLLLICVSLHLHRKDKTFAQLHLINWHIQMYLEYVIVTFPFTFTSIFTKNFFYFPTALILLWFVPYMHYTTAQKTNFKNISVLFPSANAFEWISGFRTSFLMLIPLYLLALATCWIRFLPLLLLWFITTALLNFYNEYEALNILKARYSNSKEFLHQKIKKHCAYVFIFYAPILILNCFFHPDFIDINVLFLFVQFSLIVFAITAKYSSFVPAKKNLASNITVAIVSIGSIVPYLLPLPLIFALLYYKKAVNNLNNYFHD
jgi:hypothetical protein